MSAPSSADCWARTAGSTCMPWRSMRASTPTSGISIWYMQRADPSFSSASASIGRVRRDASAAMAEAGTSSVGSGSSPER